MHTVKACKEDDFPEWKDFCCSSFFMLPWAEWDFSVTCDVKSSDIQICNLRRGGSLVHGPVSCARVSRISRRITRLKVNGGSFDEFWMCTRGGCSFGTYGGHPRSTNAGNWPESCFVCLRLKMINSHLITKANFCSSFEPYLRLSLPKLINLHELSYFPTNFLIASLCLLSLVSENSAVKKPKSSHAKGINRVPFLAGACGKAQRNLFQAFFKRDRVDGFGAG